MNQEKVSMDLKGGGWVLVVAAALCVAIAVWRVTTVWSQPKSEQDASAEDHGFNLENLEFPRSAVSAAPPKDRLVALIDPATMLPEDVKKLSGRSKYLVSTDLVIGVTLNGQSRAYPLIVLNWHGVVNDTLGSDTQGGEPILVHFCPLAGAASVFKRSFGDEVLEFGNSGLMYNSSQLLFDRQTNNEDETLWSALDARASSGPRKGQVLESLPLQLVTWKDWVDAHPNTDVIRKNPAYSKLYKQTYRPYYGEGKTIFPLTKELPNDWGSPLTPMIVLGPRDQGTAITFDHALAHSGDDESFSIDINGSSVEIHVRQEPQRAWIENPEVEVTYSFLFAWYATHPDATFIR